MRVDEERGDPALGEVNDPAASYNPQEETGSPLQGQSASPPAVMTSAAAVVLTATIESVVRYAAHLGYNAAASDPGTTDASEARGHGKHRLTARAVQASLRQCTDPVLGPV